MLFRHAVDGIVIDPDPLPVPAQGCSAAVHPFQNFHT
jgi:hypothetical protein